ncbi:hypothetical protein GCM10010967_31370 [Dyadobacter beijingensis]|uniref:Uncharacterized protein n=1 Tax=Dyadobacter beijingensis TaxID=365489 RepID=A0ABQ2HYW0_9BACT|nr:hypothetical protein [Dyadobacter beijingensis]GGM95638.1 hypothetical protein GCM10010967_31370 [Dyadobacter beijingensis]
MSKFISDELFAKWTAQWQALEHSREPFGFFKTGEKLLLGDYFDSGDLETLVSTPGIAVVKVRFGFETDKREFKLVLFGVDSAGQIITPYYAHTPGDFRPSGDGPGGNVPDVLAKRWIRYWEQKGYADDVTSTFFRSQYGFLNGYNYPVKELIAALFKFTEMPRFYIRFVLHKYFPFAEDPAIADLEASYTFGLLFQAIPDKAETGALGIDADSGYYDLSAPCPRTC